MASARNLNADLRTSEIPNLRTSYLGKGRGRNNRSKTTNNSTSLTGGTNGTDKEEVGRNSEAEVDKNDLASKAGNKILDLLKEICNQRSGVRVVELSPKEESVIIEKVLENISTGTELHSLVSCIYNWALTDPTTTSCVASLSATLSKFEKDKVCFRTALLTPLQADFQTRDEWRKEQGTRWLCFVCLLCDLYATMRTPNNEYLHALAEPVYSCLNQVLMDEEASDLHIEYATLKLKNIGKILQGHQASQMELLIEGLRTRLLGPKATAMGRLMLLETIELSASGWQLEEEVASAYTSLRQASKEQA